VVQEVDVASGQVLWEWHALGHVRIGDSYESKPSQGQIYDFFHVNSIQELEDGDLLVSSRNTWAIYLIRRSTGQILWQLGGKHGSFAMGPGTQFEWQHDARLLSGDTLTVFDNASAPKEEQESRALLLHLDTQHMQATVAASRTHSPSVLAGSQGSVQILPDGNWFVGWGDQPYFSEFKPDGTVIFDGKFPGPIQSYRAFRFDWTGRPAQPPAVARGTDSSGRATVYVSWNGATEVATWQLVGGQTKDATRVLTAAAKTGFETALPLDTSPPYLAVQAVDASGQLLATAEVPPR